MKKIEAKANIMEMANKEGRKIAISELPKIFVVEGQEVVCSDGRFRSDDRHFWPNGVKPAKGEKTTTTTTTAKKQGRKSGKSWKITKETIQNMTRRVIVGRLLTSCFCTDATKAAAIAYTNKLKAKARKESAMNQYNVQLEAKAAAKKAREERAAAAATVASNDDLLLNIMQERAAAGDAAAAAYLESINNLSEARKAESEKIAAKDAAAKVTKKGRGKKTA